MAGPWPAHGAEVGAEVMLVYYGLLRLFYVMV